MPVDFSKVKTFPIRDRGHKVKMANLGDVPDGDGFADFYDALPRVLAAEDLRAIARAIAGARREGREVVLAMGAHPIKCGLSPVIIDFMERRILTAVAMNGAGSIHDFELAYLGETSEDVAKTLQDGSFGMVEETGRILNRTMAAGVRENRGAGEAVGRHILDAAYPHAALSIQAAGARLGIDVTIHMAIGTDTIHVHPEADGAVLGKATHLDLMRYTGHIARLESGVYINLGSAVLLPEVFLKALSAVRNMGYEALHFMTVNMDMQRHYRPSENVLKRPSMTGARAVHLTGHHEIMLPLLAAAIRVEQKRLG
ncbi:MAG: GSU2086 family protein [Candidatus Latescibacterota bacterium]